MTFVLKDNTSDVKKEKIQTYVKINDFVLLIHIANTN